MGEESKTKHEIESEISVLCGTQGFARIVDCDPKSPYCTITPEILREHGFPKDAKCFYQNGNRCDCIDYRDW